MTSESDAPEIALVRAGNASPMTGEGTNSYVIGSDRVMVLDPGPGDAAHHAALLRAIADRPVAAILVSHSHLDHSEGARALAAATSAPVLGFGRHDAGLSPLMARLVDEGRAPGAAPVDMGGGEGADLDFAPDRMVADGERVESGAGWALEAIHTPGHLGNHLCFAAPGGAIFSGDHVMGWAPSMVSPPFGDMGAYLASLERLAARAAPRFLPGHGAPIEDPAARLAELAAHRRAREAKVLAALAEGAGAPEALRPRVYPEIDAAARPRLARAATRSLYAHLLLLWEQDRVRADGPPSQNAVFHLR